MIFLKSEEEIEKIRRASDIVVEVLDRLSEETKPGVSTWDLDKIAEELTLRKGAIPAFKGYRGYPASVCFALHEDPQGPNFVPENGHWGKGFRLKPDYDSGSEPMVNVRRPDIKVLGDGW